VRGPRPLPTDVKRLAGNPGRRPLNEDEPRPPRSPDLLDVPDELDSDDAARQEWVRLAAMLRDVRQITDADRGALIALCVEWSRYLDSERRIRQMGAVLRSPNGFPILNPYLAVSKRALLFCTRIWAELGLTPSSRSRVRTADGLGPSAGDEWVEFDQPHDQRPN
jgi:P27 family predicted phage terminase small subunit